MDFCQSYIPWMIPVERSVRKRIIGIDMRQLGDSISGGLLLL